MNRTPPQTLSTAQVIGADTGLLLPQRLRHHASSAELKLNGSALDPGPWYVNVQFQNTHGANQFGGVVWATISFYPKSILATIAAGGFNPAAPSGCVGDSAPFGRGFHMPASNGSIPGGAAWSEQGAWTFFGSMSFINGLGYWAGPSGVFLWADPQFVLHPHGADNFWPSWPYAPTGVTTSALVTGNAYGYGGSADPQPDFDNPIVVAVWQAGGANTDGSGGGTPSTAIDTSGLVTLYNRAVQRTFPFRMVTSDVEQYITNIPNSFGGNVESQFSTIAQWGYADISLPPVPPTRAAESGMADFGLVAVG